MKLGVHVALAALFLAFASLGISLNGASMDPDSEYAPWEAETYESPISVAVSKERGELYAISHTSDTLWIFDQADRTVIETLELGSNPTDAALSKDGRYLYVSCLYDYTILAVDLEERRAVRSAQVGYEPYGISVSQDGERLYVVNSISNMVAALATATFETVFETEVGRNPRYVTEIPHSAKIAVTNGLDRSVSFLDKRTGELLETRKMERASLLRDIVATNTGDYLIAAGLIAHDEMITMQIERGWINSNGLYILDVNQPGHYVVTPLDSLVNGAANPWGLAISSDDQHLYVSLAGVHEVAMVSLPKLLELVARTTPKQVARLSQDVEVFDRLELGKRVPTGGEGPRGLALDEDRAELYAANYFSANISVLDAQTGAQTDLIPLGEAKEPTLWRRGEMLFNDARICQQNYYSCASCHQEDGTMDGLNWDLINDGKGNPKNAKSLHDALDTPPVMWSGVRANMFAGVAAGQRFLGFIPNEENHKALLEFIGYPNRAPNPYANEDPMAVRRGEEVFYRARCAVCHIPPTFADGRKHDLDLREEFELRSRFYTPSLREAYRTAPYLHHGGAETLEEIFTKYNPDNKHGLTQGLSESELADMIAYLKSL